MLVNRGSESFEAEVVRGGETTHYLWVDPDHQRPFPKSASSVVRWMENFKPKGASPITVGDFSEQRICPSGKSPLLPLGADLNHETDGPSCGRRRP